MQNIDSSTLSVNFTKEDLECPICYEQFNISEHQPTTLPCGHDVCSNCLGSLYHNPRCPSCRSEFPINLQFKPSIHLLSIIRKINSTQKSENMRNDDSICKKHNKEVEYICISENQLLCRDCLFFENHSDHKKETLQNLVERNKEYRSHQKLAEKHAKFFLDELNNIVDLRKNEICCELNQRFNEYLDFLLRYKNSLEIQIDEYFEEYKKSYSIDSLMKEAKFPDLILESDKKISLKILQIDLNRTKKISEEWFGFENIKSKLDKTYQYIMKAKINFDAKVLEEIQKIKFLTEEDSLINKYTKDMYEGPISPIKSSVVTYNNYGEKFSTEESELNHISSGKIKNCADLSSAVYVEDFESRLFEGGEETIKPKKLIFNSIKYPVSPFIERMFGEKPESKLD